MSRSGYSDDVEPSELAMWRGVIASATRGKRGQKFFRDLIAALDAMPVKRIIADEMIAHDGEVCALAALGRFKGILGMESINPKDHDELAATFDIASQLAAEVMYQNDEGGPWLPFHGSETPEMRWTRMRAWAAEQVRP